jgi:exopolyphosphatase/guanosine-5'-triphosphate,3'-diphosphate pyrophosphatase
MKQVAVVDLGTNAMRLAIGQGTAGHYDLLKYIRYPNRLSEGMFSDGMLKQPAIERTLNALAEINAAIKAYKPHKLRLISTSVLRTAKNSKYFLDLVQEKTGFTIEIISGTEEARLIHTGAVNGIAIEGKRAFVIDIGGGSTELSVGGPDTIELAVAIENGAVRLKERFIYHDPPSAEELQAIRKAIDDDFTGVLERICSLKPQMQVGVPGNIGTIYNTLKPSDGLRRSDLKVFYDKLRLLKVNEIKSLTGLEGDKADILLPGLMILRKIMDATGMDKCYVSQKGLLHGIIINLFAS